MMFSKKRLRVGDTLSGSPAFKEFDAVSEDCSIVAMVKTYSAKNMNGNQTRHARVMRDLYYLSLVSAKQRRLYLSSDYYGWFLSQADAAIAKGIEIRIIPESPSNSAASYSST